MEIYISEIIVETIITVITSIILKIKKIKKVGIICGILIAILILTLIITYFLEKPHMENIELKMNLEVGQYTSVEIPQTLYHSKDVTNTVKVIGDINFNKIGEYEIKYEVPTLIGTYTVNQTVNIVDTTSPEITLKGEEKYNQSYAKEYVEPGYTVTDNYDENLA